MAAPLGRQVGLEQLTGELWTRHDKAKGMGGPDKIARQHEKNKLTARERLDLLFDEGTFVEFGLLATGQSVRGEPYDPEKTAADGVITGHGKVEGREVYVAAYDFTVMAGSMGLIGEQKVTPPARPGLAQPLPHRLVLGQRRSANPGPAPG